MRRGLLSDPTTRLMMRSGLVVEAPNASGRQCEEDHLEDQVEVMMRVFCGLCGSRPLFLEEWLENYPTFSYYLERIERPERGGGKAR